jgi:hypothetical protein
MKLLPKLSVAGGRRDSFLSTVFYGRGIGTASARAELVIIEVARRKELSMRRHLGTFILGAALISPVVISGCAARVYDYEGHGYHRWNAHERGYYEEWEVETHRRHEDYDRRDRDDQRSYWKWRDEHHGDDHHHHDHGHQ